MSCGAHDVAGLEALRVPAVLVLTTEFSEALRAQARAVGIQPRHVQVAHPIQDRTDDELRALADGALDGILDQLTARERRA
ncbi:MAG: hypothetical protein GEU81_09230 [Nitriliruptorales bacterium]|nr:hypothetical protein [Nitriliruptorales bacterium]